MKKFSKFGLFSKLFIFLISTGITCGAYAEYYLAENSACTNCCNQIVHHPKYHKIISMKKPHHYHHLISHRKMNSYSITVYYYTQVPTCGCHQEWVPGHCNSCGQWTSGYWQSSRNFVTFSGRAVTYRETYPANSDNSMDYDRRTADDTGSDMQIN